jgi:hypothetical protein
MKTISILCALIALASCARKPDLSGVYIYSTEGMVFTYDLQSSGFANARLVMEAYGTTVTNFEGSWDFSEGFVTVQVRNNQDKDSAKDSVGRFTVEPNGDFLTVKSPEFKKNGIRFVKQQAP